MGRQNTREIHANMHFRSNVMSFVIYVLARRSRCEAEKLTLSAQMVIFGMQKKRASLNYIGKVMSLRTDLRKASSVDDRNNSNIIIFYHALVWTKPRINLAQRQVQTKNRREYPATRVTVNLFVDRFYFLPSLSLFFLPL